MAIRFSFHPEALVEFTEATNFYLQRASRQVADEFVNSVESAIACLVDEPTLWRVVDEPGLRRCILKRFPYVIYYYWDIQSTHIILYAIMHCSRKPDYWRTRVESDT